MDSGKMLLGVLTGVATGAMLGVLFAPAKGAKTRKKIMDKGDDYADVLKGKIDEFIEGVSEAFEKAKEQAADMAKENKEKADQTKKDVKAATH